MISLGGGGPHDAGNVTHGNALFKTAIVFPGPLKKNGRGCALCTGSCTWQWMNVREMKEDT